MYGIFYISYFFWVTPACVWCYDASTFTGHETHQTSNLNMKYSGEHNEMQYPDHRQTLFAANSCVCVSVSFPIILDVKIVGSTSRHHTGFLIHLIPAVRAFILGNGQKREYPVLFWPKTDVPENDSGRECCWPYLIGQHPLSHVFGQNRPGTPGNSYFAQLSPVFGHFMFLSGGLLDYSNRSTWATRIWTNKSKISLR